MMSKIGKIKRFNANRGFGFITYKNESHKRDEDIFFHIKQVSDTDKECIAGGYEVEFDIGVGRNGRPEARKVKIIDHFYLPLDTMLVLNPLDIDNVSLRINKAANYDYDNNKFVLDKIRFPNSTPGSGPYSKLPLKEISSRQDKAIKGMGLITADFEMIVDWRMAVGIGSPTVYETSMTFHHIYGIPYIPGTAVKGITRNKMIADLFGNIEGNEQEGALSVYEFCLIFGSPAKSALGARKGIVMFFDAYPVTEPILRLDVMTPH